MRRGRSAGSRRDEERGSGRLAGALRRAERAVLALGMRAMAAVADRRMRRYRDREGGRERDGGSGR